MNWYSLTLFSVFFISIKTFGAACCGGGVAIPAIIAGDDKAQFSSSYSYSEVVVDNVDSSGLWRRWDDHQKTQMFRAEGAHIFNDRWQVGISVPVVERQRLNQKYSGLADVSTSLGYEYLPDWDYNPYRPKGIGYLQLTLPTGKARAESEVGGMDSRGNGFWAFGVGTLLTKSFSKWDALTTFEVHRSFSKSVSNSQIQGTISPGYGGNFGLGGGFNTTSWRFGSMITWTYEDSVDIKGTTSVDGSIERYATAVLSASYLANEQWAGTISYADQTLFGEPINTSLGRTIALQIQRKWSR